MEIAVVNKGTPLDFTLEVDCAKAYKLLHTWRVSREILDPMQILFEFNPKLTFMVAGRYRGRKDNQHLIFLGSSYFRSLNGDELNSELNTTIIHELRHAYWRIISANDYETERGFTTHCHPWIHSAELQKEEEDCNRIELEYKDWKLVTVLKTPSP